MRVQISNFKTARLLKLGLSYGWYHMLNLTLLDSSTSRPSLNHWRCGRLKHRSWQIDTNSHECPYIGLYTLYSWNFVTARCFERLVSVSSRTGGTNVSVSASYVSFTTLSLSICNGFRDICMHLIIYGARPWTFLSSSIEHWTTRTPSPNNYSNLCKFDPRLTVAETERARVASVAIRRWL